MPPRGFPESPPARGRRPVALSPFDEALVDGSVEHGSAFHRTVLPLHVAQDLLAFRGQGHGLRPPWAWQSPTWRRPASRTPWASAPARRNRGDRRPPPPCCRATGA